MAVEGDQYAGIFLSVRPPYGGRDHPLVTAMHAIERADAGNRAGPLGPERIDSEVNLHAAGFYRSTGVRFIASERTITPEIITSRSSQRLVQTVRAQKSGGNRRIHTPIRERRVTEPTRSEA